jgi:hypothetical protein
MMGVGFCQHDASPAALRDFLLLYDYGLFSAEHGKLEPISDLSNGPGYFNVFALPLRN